MSTTSADIRTDAERTAYRNDHEEVGGYASRIRGGSVWGGAAVGLGTLLLLELILLTSGLSGASLHADGASGGSFAWDAVAGAVSFLLAGLVAGASSSHRDVNTGVLNAVVAWASIIVGTIVISSVLGSTVFGAIGNIASTQQHVVSTASNAASNAQITQSAVDTFRDTAGWAALSGAVALALCALGGAIGSKMGETRRTTARTVTTR